jgi:hypothetical protein
MGEKYQHRCRWLYQFKREADEYNREQRPKAVLYCWQTGKSIRGSECTQCLVARLITVRSSVVNSLPHKQPMTLGEWEKSHKGPVRRGKD